MNDAFVTSPSGMPDDLRARTAEINFDSTISRRLVHRNYIDHVLVTDVVRLQENRFLCGARLPQSHMYFNETARGGRCSSILLGAETMRQACMALSHKFLEISPSFLYILQRARCHVENDGPRTLSPEACNLVLDITLTNHAYRRSGELMGLVAEAVTYCASERIMTARGEWMFVPKKMYERLRKPNGDAHACGNGSGSVVRQMPIAPELVGRRGPLNVVITPVTLREPDLFEAYVVVDPQHPYFFEHALDHVSGMLLLEACNQVGIAAASRLCGLAPHETFFKCFDANFQDFATLDEPIVLAARVRETADEPFGPCALSLEIDMRQGARPLGSCRTGMAAEAPAAVAVPEPRIMAGSESA